MTRNRKVHIHANETAVQIKLSYKILLCNLPGRLIHWKTHMVEDVQWPPESAGNLCVEYTDCFFPFLSMPVFQTSMPFTFPWLHWVLAKFRHRNKIRLLLLFHKVHIISSPDFPSFPCDDGLSLCRSLIIQQTQFYIILRFFLISCLAAGKFLILCARQPVYTGGKKGKIRKRHRMQ